MLGEKSLPLGLRLESLELKNVSRSREYRRDRERQTVVSVWKFLHMHANCSEQEHCFRGKDLQLQNFQDIFVAHLPIDTAESVYISL
jgi:hypothetical protein